MKNLRKVTAVVMSAVMCCTGMMYTKNTKAADDTKTNVAVWNGDIDTKWSGKGTKSSPYLIYTPGELAGVVTTSESSRGAYYKLMADIDLGGKPLYADDIDGKWGGYNWGDLQLSGFYGNFDGNDHVITGYYGGDGDGIFGDVSALGVISNLTIYGRTDGAGVICNDLYGEVSDCVSYVRMMGSCGGIIFTINDGAVVKNCYNYGDVNVNHYAAGIVGVVGGDNQGTKKILNCANFGYITLNDPESAMGGCAGGIVAYTNTPSYAGGSCLIQYCDNFGEVYVPYRGGAGGIVGVCDYSVKLEYCANYGDITSVSLARGSGGIVGHRSSESGRAYITDCLNKGTINAEGYDTRSGGMSGSRISGDGAMRCYSIGNVSGNYHVGIGPGNVKNCYYVGDAQLLTTHETEYSAIWETYPENGIIEINGGFDYYEINELSKLQNGFPVLKWEEDRFDIETLKCISADQTQLKLKWSLVSRATGYELYRTNVENGEMTKIATVTENTYTDAQLDMDSTYYYQVRSFRTENGHTYYGECSTVLKATTLSEVVPEESEAPEQSDESKESQVPQQSETPEESQQPTYYYGDADKDGQIKLNDAQLTLKAALKITLPDELTKLIMDVDKNGAVELRDAQLVLKAALKII